MTPEEIEYIMSIIAAQTDSPSQRLNLYQDLAYNAQLPSTLQSLGLPGSAPENPGQFGEVAPVMPQYRDAAAFEALADTPMGEFIARLDEPGADANTIAKSMIAVARERAEQGDDTLLNALPMTTQTGAFGSSESVVDEDAVYNLIQNIAVDNVSAARQWEEDMAVYQQDRAAYETARQAHEQLVREYNDATVPGGHRATLSPERAVAEDAVAQGKGLWDPSMGVTVRTVEPEYDMAAQEEALDRLVRGGETGRGIPGYNTPIPSVNNTTVSESLPEYAETRPGDPRRGTPTGFAGEGLITNIGRSAAPAPIPGYGGRVSAARSTAKPNVQTFFDRDRDLMYYGDDNTVGLLDQRLGAEAHRRRVDAAQKFGAPQDDAVRRQAMAQLLNLFG